MGLFRLHVHYPLLVTFLGQFVRYAVLAVVVVGGVVVVNRARGVSPAAVRGALPEWVLLTMAVAFVLAAVTAWRKVRKRNYYRRSRYS